MVEPTYREYWRGFPKGMTPACDRCGHTLDGFGVMDGPSLRVYCGDCLTMVEKRCCDLGVSPFEPDADSLK